MQAVCPVDPTHKAFFAAGTRDVACMTCHEVYRETKAARESKPKRANKYGAVKVETSLGRADSLKEGARLEALRLLETAGEITDLIAHPSFDLIAWSPAGPRIIGRYTADAGYRERGRPVVEDVKSEATRKRQDYSLRRRIFLANNPHIEFRET